MYTRYTFIPCFIHSNSSNIQSIVGVTIENFKVGMILNMSTTGIQKITFIFGKKTRRSRTVTMASVYENLVVK